MKIKKSQLTREILESYAGKTVKVTLFNGDSRTGILQLGNGFFYESKKYAVKDLCFRLSHIKSIEV